MNADFSYRFLDNAPCDLKPGKVVCVGRNYAKHAAELNNPIPDSPILFIKPSTSLVSLESGFSLPENKGECHHEVEMAVLIGTPLKTASDEKVEAAIAGIGIGLDLTLRDVQNQLKEKGQPWEIAKAFDGSCPLTHFVVPEKSADLSNFDISLEINGEVRQQGNTSEMLWPVVPLIKYISEIFTLLPGDVVLTGTPAGVGPLQKGDDVQVKLGGLLRASSKVV